MMLSSMQIQFSSLIPSPKSIQRLGRGGSEIYLILILSPRRLIIAIQIK